MSPGGERGSGSGWAAAFVLLAVAALAALVVSGSLRDLGEAESPLAAASPASAPTASVAESPSVRSGRSATRSAKAAAPQVASATLSENAASLSAPSEATPPPAPEKPKTASYQWYEGPSGYETAVREGLAEGKAVAVYFYTDWCGYCRQLERELLSTATVSEGLKYVVKVRVNPEHGPAAGAVADTYGVKGYPSFFIHSATSGRLKKIGAYRGNGEDERLKTPQEFAQDCQKAAK